MEKLRNNGFIDTWMTNSVNNQVSCLNSDGDILVVIDFYTPTEFASNEMNFSHYVLNNSKDFDASIRTPHRHTMYGVLVNNEDFMIQIWVDGDTKQEINKHLNSCIYTLFTQYRIDEPEGIISN